MGASKRGFYLFCQLFYFEFFLCKWKLLQTNHISATGHQCFHFFQRNFKVEAAFLHSGNVFFNILHPASTNRFSSYWKHYFLVSAISLLVETIIGIRRKRFWEKQLVYWTTEILASGNHFFPHFSETFASDSLFSV